MFNEDDVGQVKVEVAAKKLKKINPEIEIEALPISINDYNVIDVVEGCDVVVDALDSVNARYSLNKACVEKNIPFVTGAAVGVTGQVFTVLPKKTACYNCLFPILDEDAMPTCSIDGVHPSILSIVGGMQVHEAVDVLIGKIPPSSKKFVSIDLENFQWSDMDISNSKREECSVCGSGKKKEVSRQELILEELCGRNMGSRTFSITPTYAVELNVDNVTNIAKDKGFLVENQGELGLSLRTNDLSVSFMKSGSAVVVGPKDESEAISLYKELIRRS